MKKILGFTIYTILLIGCKTAPPKETKLNIIFILADDWEIRSEICLKTGYWY